MESKESQNNIGSLVRKMETDYINGTTKISEHVDFSMYDTINTIDAYINSKHTSGLFDSLGREKPFFNIVTAAVNIWYRATDIDRKNIRIKATKGQDVLASFLASIHLQEYMRREKIGSFLNDWGRTMAIYGSAVAKFVRKGGRLHTDVIPFNRLICDAIDFENNPKIEKLQLTKAQLLQNKSYDQDVVKSLLDAVSARKTIGRQTQDNKADYIEVYEVHGELPLSYITGKEEDDDEFVQQMQVISFVGGKKKGDYEDFVLVKGREAKDPYFISHLIKEDGRAIGMGAVEHLFEAQWMQNHTAKSIKDQLDLASKLIFQTSDTAYVSQNALESIETGDILIHAPNAPLTQVANNSHDITSLQNYGQQWKTLAQEITSTPDAISGNNMPSGTAYRQVAILNQESHSLFEIMTENKGLAIEEMLREHIIPFLKTKMDTSDEIAATLESHDIKKLDSMYISYEAVRRYNAKVIDAVLDNEGEQPTGVDLGREVQDVEAELGSMGNQRFIKPSEIGDKTWKEMFKDLEWDVEVEITNETSDKEAVMTTLTTLLQTIATNPNILVDPRTKFLFNKIVASTGSVSELELSSLPTQPTPAVASAAPQQAQPQQTP